MTSGISRSPRDAAVLVTGGSGGNGSAVARRLAAEGSRVFLCGRDLRRTAAVADSIPCPYWTGDLRDPSAAVRAVDAAVRALHGLDTVVAAAGSRGRTTDVSSPLPDECEDVLSHNVITMSNTLTASLPVLAESARGTFLGISSLAGLTGYDRFPYYTAAKAATVGLVRAVAPTARRQGVRVRVLCLYFTDTPLISDVLADLVHEGIPVQSTADVAAAVTACLQAPGTSTVWTSTPGTPPEPYAFRRIQVPGTTPAQTSAPPPAVSTPAAVGDAAYADFPGIIRSVTGRFVFTEIPGGMTRVTGQFNTGLDDNDVDRYTLEVQRLNGTVHLDLTPAFRHQVTIFPPLSSPFQNDYPVLGPTGLGATGKSLVLKYDGEVIGRAALLPIG
ncbi:SDR family oxidoreductase [Streptomyces nitrosporeus]|uniref:SDR family oxidoreductase n=1 Tax=Streptomyces nitrosporeus TaxID=28894 RepID=A0A5J6F5E7_9ACTN|nr:SDR family oxidoreductase [Streptomyces nitrosporeus]QEU71263.1 SDR family oxidoreductase [Streptomyces nitrosporeus]GGY99362.1 hypothetical protein GCM10010327_32470 [Streptomyces nitrosporeus]